MSKQQLKFGDEKIHATTITTSGDVAMDSARIIAKGEEPAVVGRLKLTEYDLKDLDGPATLVHKTKLTKAQIVSDELIEDILDSHVEATTGQLQLLSTAGEGRRAARLGLDERRRQIDELGYTVDHDDEGDTSALLDCAARQVDQLRGLVAESDDWEIREYFEALEIQFVQLMGVAIAGVEYTRRRLNEHLEAEARAEAERAAATRAEEAAKNGGVTDAMAVHADEEADKRERREPDVSDIEEGSEFDGSTPAGSEEEVAAV